ncbi:NAD(P)-binding domain-containing protein [Amnibacterium flavum]|uniref:Flavoprotein n=1 Tax=Amnibacterium flavum TaxID=2173173 RepID=A0A2V1HSU1_9MICO|nr:NAD(P)-binding domain-containing protein [Amnibacterium flavum]PVZ93144.1 flavoprotein [Amnibacterium flavum]
MEELPVVVIGAGPQGLAAAAHLVERGIEPLVLEKGATAGAAVTDWSHVRLFSEWPELVDAAAARLLQPTGWTQPTGYPRGRQWVSAYLAPLAEALTGRIRYGTTVTGIGRRGRDRLVDEQRGSTPFTLHIVDAEGTESRIEARAVIDASGTWNRPNPAGADGLPALGETSSPFVSYRIPDFGNREPFAGAHTIVLGSGHSALTAIIELSRIARYHPDTRITWVLRRGDAANAFGGGAADELPERGALGLRARALVEAGAVNLLTGFRVQEVRSTPAGAVLIAEDGRELPAADQVVALTGFRPDLSFLSELRLELDPTLQAPVRIAQEVDPNLHSCGSVRATGAADLAHPEPGLYIVGAKSYGRAPTFLAMTGYEQVRSVVAELAGDHEAARRVELVLPETGVCGGSGLFDNPSASAGACCAPPVLQQNVTIGRRQIEGLVSLSN